MRAVLCGANGAMGKLITGLMGEEIVGKVSIDGENGVAKTFAELGTVEADVVIDFSHHSAVSDVLRYAKQIGAAAVIGTTGHTPEEKALIFAASEEIPVFYAGNVSLGIAVLCRLVKQAAAFFPDADIEIVETHHTRKVDHVLRLKPFEDTVLQASRYGSLRAKIGIFPKDNAKVRHAGSGNARTVPHSSAWFRKGPKRTDLSVGGRVIINF